jgi:hypothetical protein
MKAWKKLDMMLCFGSFMYPKTTYLGGSITNLGTLGRWWNIEKVGPSRRKLGYWGHAFARVLGFWPLFLSLFASQLP